MCQRGCYCAVLQQFRGHRVMNNLHCNFGKRP
jgi:hypothetical protein